MADTTPNRGYPLPVPSNRLSNDVLTLRDGFRAIDADIQQLGNGVANASTKAELTDARTAINVVIAQKADAGEVNSRMAGKADKATTLSGYGITDAVGPRPKTLTAGTDLNTLPEANAVYDGSFLVNAPYGVGNWAYVSMLTGSGAGYAVQTCRALDAQGPTFERRKLNGVWGIWRPIGVMPARDITDSGGHFYTGGDSAGLNVISTIKTAGKCDKFMPAYPIAGDVVIVFVANGRDDNTLWVNSQDKSPIMGLNENFIIDNPSAGVQLVMTASSGWRALVS